MSDFENVRQWLSHQCVLVDNGKLVELSELFHRNAKFSVCFDSTPSHTGRDPRLVCAHFSQACGQASSSAA